MQLCFTTNTLVDNALVFAVVVTGVILVVLGISIGLLLGRARNARSSTARPVQPVQPVQPIRPSATTGPVPPVLLRPSQAANSGLGPITGSGSGTGGSGGPVVVSCGDYLTNGRFRNTQAARVGREGEDRVVTEIERALDSRWYVFRNVVLPGNNADLDIVLVGPGGTWVLEVKAYSGSWRVEKGKWYKLTSNGYWAHHSFGPGAQAIQNAKRLCNHLKANGMTRGVAVNPVVIVAQDTQIDFVSAGTRIWRLPDLPGRLADLSRRNYHDQWRVQEITALLQPQAANRPLVH